ncbi:MAG: sensor histidine kinase [Hyphomicrobiales bacterium]
MANSADHNAQAIVDKGKEMPKRRLLRGLSTKLLLLTILFVMLSEIFIYIPSLANFRNTWLSDRVERAAIALRVAEEAGNFDMLSDRAAAGILEELGVKTIAVSREGRRQLVAMSDMPDMITSEFDTRSMEPTNAIMEAIQSLLSGSSRTTRVTGLARGMNGPDGQPIEVEIVLQETGLQIALFDHSINILKLSLMISIITASLVFLSLRALFVRPFRHVTKNMVHFSEDPEDPARVIPRSRRSDEIGVAQNQLSDMQGELQKMLAEKRTLADLGLAVSKINHDLRNILASAVLFSDRLQAIDDPVVQRFTPKLVRALDRAIDYCQSTLSYGRAREAPPSIRVVQLHTLVLEVSEVLGLDTADQTVRFENLIAPQVTVAADPDQLFRVLLNLCRNALHAMTKNSAEMADSVVNCLTIGYREKEDYVCITISDTGPGIPEMLRGSLFKAFQSSSGPGGTGLGLAIAAELVRAHEGSLTLDDTTQGASFTIHLPKRSSTAPTLASKATLRVVDSHQDHSA